MRERSSTICRKVDLDEVLAKKAFNPILNGYNIGYKLHLITTEKWIYRGFMVTPANSHDYIFLKELGVNDRLVEFLWSCHCTILWWIKHLEKLIIYLLMKYFYNWKYELVALICWTQQYSIVSIDNYSIKQIIYFVV